MRLRTLPIFLAFFAMGFVDAMGPLASTIQKQYSLSGFMAGLLPAFAFVAFAIFSVPGGVLAARIGKRNLLVLALVLSGLGVLVPTAVVPGFALLLASVFVLGVGTTLLQVAGNPIMRDVSGEGRFASNLSLAQFVKGVGSVGSTYLVGRLAVGELGWRRIFPVFLALTVVTLVSVMVLKVKETRAEVPPSVGSSLSLLGEPAFGLAVLGIFLYVGAEVGMNTWLGPRLESLGFTAERFTFFGLDLGRASTALGSTLFFVGLTSGRLLGSGVLRTIAAKTFFRLSATLGFVGILGVLSGVPALAVAGVLLAGLGFGNIWPVLFSLTVEARPERSAELSGLMCMAIFGGAVLPPLMGRVADTVGLGTAFLVPLAAFAYLLALAMRGGAKSPAKAA
ncbi:MAG TPA: MFS transporter [Vicinamibacteria bacterium]|nr:MFS transporter [Vicinamibacteria bacterium]